MSKIKAITLSNTPKFRDHDIYVITIGASVNSVWDDLEEAQDEVEYLEHRGNQSVVLSKVNRNKKYISPAERPRSVVMTSAGEYTDSDGNVYIRGLGINPTRQN